LNGSTSGYTELDAPAVAGSNTLVLPGGNGTADQVLSTNGSGTLSFVDRGRMVLETAQATTSGTSKDFTGIPSWVKRITVMFQGVSTNGTSNYLVQIGTSSGVASSGYVSGAFTSNTNNTSSTAGFLISALKQAAPNHSGIATICSSGNNTWVHSSVLGWSNGGADVGGGNVTLSGTLDRVRITTVNGTDTFDAGSVNILLEG
jgi:hypothetical protein